MPSPVTLTWSLSAEPGSITASEACVASCGAPRANVVSEVAAHGVLTAGYSAVAAIDSL